MNIVSIDRVHEDHVKESAHYAADLDQGTQANPFPHDSAAFITWNRLYYARIKENAEACAS